MRSWLIGGLMVAIFFSILTPIELSVPTNKFLKSHTSLPSPPALLPMSGSTALLVQASRWQIGVTTAYDGSYTKIGYPNGDVPIETGVCADVIIRAFRTAFKKDLQKEVHEDMDKHFSLYPQAWWLTKTDSNIDHRRVRNLMVYFNQQKWSISNEHFEPGDIIAWQLSDGQHHIGILSNTPRTDGNLLVIHNIGRGTEESDTLNSFTRIGHWRVK